MVPEVIKKYEELISKGKNFEIIVFSGDKTDHQMMAYFQTLPFKSFEWVEDE